MYKEKTYTAKELNAILQSSWNPELKKIHVRNDREPGRGGMSNGVFEVALDGSKKRWALKVIDAENFDRVQGTDGSEGSSVFLPKKVQQAEKQIAREKGMQKDLSDLRNQYFVPAVKFYETDGVHLIQMPYYDSAADYEGDLEEGAIQLGTDICQALLALHFDDRDMAGSRHGILIHGDIKPQNIFYEKSGGTVRFKLGDFGSVRHLGEPCFAHSKGYHAPEEELGSKNVQPNADLFSLGLVMYWYVSGKDDQLEYRAWEQRCAGAVPKRPADCSDQLWEIILDATEPDPEDRIQTADEMQKRLRDIDRRKLVVSEEKNRQLTKTNNMQSTILKMGTITAVAAAAGYFLEKMTDKASARQNEEQLTISEVGGWYTGASDKNRPCGQGTYHYSDGSTHSGHWVWKTGETVLLFGETEVTASGMFCGGSFEGFWIVESPDGWGYRGEVKSDRPYGTGRFTFSYKGEEISLSGKWSYADKKKIPFFIQGSAYTGMLCGGEPNGWGTFKLPRTGTFRGILRDGGACVGRFEWESGEIYDGEWLHLEDQEHPDGKGLHISPDGSCYEGQFVQSNYEGYGVKTYPDGSRYEGQWKKGKRHGEGTFTDSDGRVLRTVWKDDQPIK